MNGGLTKGTRAEEYYYRGWRLEDQALATVTYNRGIPNRGDWPWGYRYRGVQKLENKAEAWA